MSETTRVPSGLDGVVVAETTIGKSDADGSLIYRGYSIQDLFDNASLEEVAYLVLKGRLPNRGDLDGFDSGLRSSSVVPEKVYDVVRALPGDAHPMDTLRTAVSALGAMSKGASTEEREISLAAKMPALVGNCYRISNGLPVLQPRRDHGYAANMLYMITGKEPTKFEAWAFERELILYVEHDLNASSFTVRVVASTMADIHAAATAGCAALKGPLHGGANEAAMELMLAVGKPENARTYVNNALAKKQLIMGFGHRVYKTVDPRAQLSKKLLRRLLDEKKADDGIYRLAVEIEAVMWESKKLPANLDFYAAPIFYTLGIPIPVYTPIFAGARIFGWTAHYNEQLKENRLIRPDAIYTGPKDLKYRPVEDRQ